jgi:hypothetical protein
MFAARGPGAPLVGSPGPRGHETRETGRRMPDVPQTCRYCGSQLKKWRVPDGASWIEEYFLVCFNDECSYYKDGWTWMWEQYRQRASYRFAVNPTNGTTLMIPVWSETATRNLIIEEREEEDG